MSRNLASLLRPCHRWIRSALTRFGKRTSGSITVETMLIFPLIAWGLMASLTFTDGFRHQSKLQKSVFTVGDLVSRSSGTVINADYIAGIYTLMRRMNDTPAPLSMRISLIGWDDDAEELRVVWSNGNHSGGRGRLDDAHLNAAYAAHVPMITQGETLLLTEGWIEYAPLFRVGLRARTVTEVALTRPRFAPGIPYDDPDAPPPPPAWCEFIVDGCGM